MVRFVVLLSPANHHVQDGWLSFPWLHRPAGNTPVLESSQFGSVACSFRVRDML
jgi:hypothetical protein